LILTFIKVYKKLEIKIKEKKVIPQYPLPSGFADIVVFLENEISIIELKIEELSDSHVLQLEGYLKEILFLEDV